MSDRKNFLTWFALALIAIAHVCRSKPEDKRE